MNSAHQQINKCRIGVIGGLVVILQTIFHMYKITCMLLLCAMAVIPTKAQEQVPVAHFEKIIASPRVNLIISEGNTEEVRILYNRVPKEKVNVRVKGKTLKIYLDHAKTVEKQVRYAYDGNRGTRGIYDGMSITAYVTYRKLTKLEIRGEEELRSDTPITADKFKLKAFGETEITLAGMNARRFKVAMYGNNHLNLKSGTIEKQKYKLFGENNVQATHTDVQRIVSSIYGEGHMRVRASDKFTLSAFGEPSIQLLGSAHVHKRIVLGVVNVN